MGVLCCGYSWLEAFAAAREGCRPADDGDVLVGSGLFKFVDDGEGEVLGCDSGVAVGILSSRVVPRWTLPVARPSSKTAAGLR